MKLFRTLFGILHARWGLANPHRHSRWIWQSNGYEEPLCIIETTEVNVMPFNRVDADFAHDEGEGDRSLEFWREAHWKAFSLSCDEIGREPVETMPVVCERFRVIFSVNS